MQKPPEAHPPVVFQSEAHGRDDGGIFYPEDPQGGKRPLVVVPGNCPIADIQTLTGRVRASYNFIRQLAGYVPMKCEVSMQVRA